jgi:hypothetical protein
MNPIERSAKLRQEADIVAEEIGLWRVLSSYGRVVPTGSYFLDVMVYPDVDLYMSKVSLAQLFEIGAQLAESDLVFEVVFAKSKVTDLPGGLYLKPRVEYGDWGRPWKFDIWSIEDALIEEKMACMYHFRDEMTESLRERILNYKVSVLTEGHRTPMYSGYFIYKAFIDEGLTDFQQVTQYLIDNGIEMGPIV